MSNYYVDINNSSLLIGDGSIGSPFTYHQMVNFFNPEYIINGELANVSAVSNDIVYIKGSKSIDYMVALPSEIPTFLSLHYSLSGSITLEGWDVDTYGSPIIYKDGGLFCLFDRGDDYLLSANDSSLDLTIKNVIFHNYNNFHFEHPNVGTLCVYVDSNIASLRKIDISFKTTIIKSDTFFQNYNSSFLSITTSAYSDLLFYGCTIESRHFGLFYHINTFELYDCVCYISSLMLDLSPFTTIKANNNITNIQNFSLYIGAPGNVVDYIEPIYNTSIIGYSYYTTSINQIAYFQNITLMGYNNFNIPIGGALESFRVSNDYNTGLFGDVRIAYGAYSFKISDEFIGNGHIGSFYFGGDFNNAIVSINPGVLEILSLSHAGVNASTDKFSVINISVPEVKAFGFNSFPFQISGSNVNGTYPLHVKYRVYDYEPRGQFEGLWEAYEFRWWFDYETSAGQNQYIATTNDTIDWVYCGVHNQTYDVRCMVMYRPI